MSFGKHEYQHRFYRCQPHKQLINPSNNQSRVLPLVSYQPEQPNSPPQQQHLYTPQIPRQNPLNIRLRAGEIGYNEPGWEGYRLRSYVVENYGQNYRNYENDRDTIQRFKREAEEYRRRLRFGNNRPKCSSDTQPSQEYTHLPQVRLRTEPVPETSNYQQAYQSPPHQENPEQPIDRYDVGIMARVHSRDKQRNDREERQERLNSREEHRKLKEYRKKYSKLKQKLKEELRLHHRANTFKQEEENSNIIKIQRLITDISQRIAKNTLLFNEGLHVEQELRQLRPPSPQPISHKSPPRQGSFKQEANQVHYLPIEREEQFPAPRIVYNARHLDHSYLQLKKVNDQMNEKRQIVRQKRHF